MKHEIETAYVGVGSADPAAIARYLKDVVGLMPGEPTSDGDLSFRVDGKAHRVIVQQAAREDATFIGFVAVDEEAFERVARRLRDHDVELTAGDVDRCRARRVERLFSMRTPWGIPVELVLGLQEASTPFHSDSYRGGFVTEGQGFGHVVLGLGDEATYEASRRFAIDALGLELSDWLNMPIGPVNMHVSFLHCNPRHHSLALACVPLGPPPQTLHHINFEVASVDPVGAALERALQSRTRVANLIGKHQNDGMVSFYSTSPGGWHVEIGATGRTIGDDWNDVREYQRISEWGHQPPQVLAQMQPAAAAGIVRSAS
ncbi:VOC family protein [soil metagenome]